MISSLALIKHENQIDKPKVRGLRCAGHELTCLSLHFPSLLQPPWSGPMDFKERAERKRGEEKLREEDEWQSRTEDKVGCGRMVVGPSGQHNDLLGGYIGGQPCRAEVLMRGRSVPSLYIT